MKVHHLNCATLCPRIPKGLLGYPHIVCHCVLVETNEGLVLVDTGLGSLDLQQPTKRLGRIFTQVMNPRFSREETALAQVEGLGFRREDVRHIVMTHLDLDHGGGIADFPDAEVHIFEGEYEAAMSRPSKLEELRYHPLQWSHGPKWKRHELQGEQWFGFQSVRALSPHLPEILLVPLVGHTRGHCGVAIRSGEGWLLHAGDAYFFHSEMDVDSPKCSHGLKLFQNLVQVDARARLENQRRLRELKNEQKGRVEIFCAHSPLELEKLQRM